MYHGGSFADIDEDPDSPDANWMVATGNNVNISVRTSFPTPTGNPTVGADLQEFKAWVRQYDENQGGTPDCRLELWEDGVLVRAGSDTPVPDGGLLISFTWNANELGTADGSLVECNVVGTKSGGAPANRNTVDVGAVEWNVTYDAGGVVNLAGSSAGIAGVTSFLRKTIPLAGTADGVSTSASALSILLALVGVSDGVATVDGILKPLIGLVATSDGVATVIGVLSTGEVVELIGTSAGSSLVADAVLRKTIPFVGASDGVAAVAGLLKGTWAFHGTSDGVAGVVGNISPIRGLLGTADGAATVDGVLLVEGQVLLAGTSDGGSTVDGALSVLRTLTGISDGVAGVVGVLLIDRGLVGGSDGAATAVAVLTVSGEVLLIGTSDGICTVVGSLGDDEECERGAGFPVRGVCGLRGGVY